VVGAGVGEQVRQGLGGGAGDGGVNGDLVLVAIVDGLDVEGGEQFFRQRGRGVGENVPEDGQLVQERRVVLFGGGCFQGG
jgi:hypothetical protein